MKILIVRLSSIGDVIQGIPCLVALKESFPDWEISWLVEETSAPILHQHPHLTKLFVLQRPAKRNSSSSSSPAGAMAMWPLRRALRQESFDVTIDLQGLFKSGFWTLLSGAPRRIGHDRTREGAHLFLTEVAGNRPVFDPAFCLIERYLEPARLLGADTNKGRYVLPPPSAQTISEVNSLPGMTDTGDSTEATRRFTVALCPWSSWPSKNWPIARWKEVAVSLARDFRVLLIGAASDLIAADQICSNLPRVINLTGKTSLLTLAEVFRRCQIVIGPDSGPLHLANATGVPRLIMLFGSTSWQRSGPFGNGHRSLFTDLPCQPCFERVCPLGHLNCQQFLEVKQVLAAVHELSGAPG